MHRGGARGGGKGARKGAGKGFCPRKRCSTEFVHTGRLAINYAMSLAPEIGPRNCTKTAFHTMSPPCASQHLGNQVTSASWLRKKTLLRDAKCRGSTGALCRKPGPKKGATNLPAGLLSFESRPQFWVQNLDLFLGPQNTSWSCAIWATRTDTLRHVLLPMQAGSCTCHDLWTQLFMILYVYIYICVCVCVLRKNRNWKPLMSSLSPGRWMRTPEPRASATSRESKSLAWLVTFTTSIIGYGYVGNMENKG